MNHKNLILIFLLAILIVLAGCGTDMSGEAKRAVEKEVVPEHALEEVREPSAPLFKMEGDTVVSVSSETRFQDLDLSVNRISRGNLNKVIQERGASWTAGENKFSGKSDEELKKMLGLNINLAEVEKRREEARNFKGQRYDLPDHFDWRDQHGQNYVTSIKDQQQCGSCWAFSAVGALEGHANAFYNNPSLDINMSEQDLVSCSGAGTCGGGWPSLALSYIQQSGVCQETCFPYTATDISCDNKCGNWQDDAWSITSWTDVPLVRDEIKHALITKGPLSIGMAVYYDFFNYDGGIYSHTTDNLAGYHAIVLVGYGQEDGLEYWICKNSWGEDWGEDGYFRILMGDSMIDSFFVNAVDSPNPVIPEQVICNDADTDGYCNWGLGNKPDNCPVCDALVKDCDDSNAGIFENCGLLENAVGSLEVTSIPTDAEVYVRDTVSGNYLYRGNTPLTFNLNPGLRTIKISKYAYNDYIINVTIEENQTTNLQVNLSLAPMLYYPENNDVLRLGDYIRIIGTVPEQLQNFYIEYSSDGGASYSTQGIELIDPAGGAIINDTIAIWNTSFLTQAGFFDIKLTASYGNEVVYKYIYQIYLDPTLKEGWPIKLKFDYTEEEGGCYYWAGSLQTVTADINNDGFEEIIVYKGGIPPKLYVYKYDGSLLWSKNIGTTQGMPGGNLPAAPIVGNIDNSGDLEIAVPLSDFDQDISYLYVLDSAGNSYGNFPIEVPYAGGYYLAMKNLNLDGHKEIVLKGWGTYQANPKIVVVNKDAQIISFFYLTEQHGGATLESSPAFGNFDNDPELEIVVAKPGPTAGAIWENGTLVGFDNTGEVSVYNLDGSQVAGWPVNTDGIIYSSPAVGDINNDGDLEIIVATMYSRVEAIINYSLGGVYTFDNEGNILPGWPFGKGDHFWSSPSLADFNGDGYLEVGISKLINCGGGVCQPAKSYIIRYDGTVFDGWPQYLSWNDYYSTISGDITGNNVADLLTTAGSAPSGGGVYAFNFDGSLISGFPKFTEVDAQAAATISDIDNDGKLELIASSDWDYDWVEQKDKYRGTIYVWELDSNLNQETMHWPRFHHDIGNTGLYAPSLACQNSTLTSCGESFPPDCNALNQQVCCGDDSGENYRFRDCADSYIYADSCSDSQEDNACCDASTDCVVDGVCYTTNTAGSFQNNMWQWTNEAGTTGYYKCLNTPSHIYDCDQDPNVCENLDWACNVDVTKPYGRAAGWAFEGETAPFGGYGDSWGRGIGTWGSYDPGPSAVINGAFEECCGDDAGEYLITSGTMKRCCNAATDTLDVNGNCKTKTTKKPPVSEIQQP